MARLPQPGADNGDWGNILNTYLLQAHTTDGALKNNVVATSAVQDGAITEVKLDAATQTKLSNLTSGLAAKANSNITITGANSVTGGGDLTANRTLSLVNDTATPGNDRYYGTNGSGAKGFHNLPTGTTLPSQTGNNGKFLTTNGSTTSWADTPAANSGYINVKDYGAVGDGTTNDATAIQAAAAAVVNGSTLYFPRGNYRFASAGTAVTISGKSRISILFDPSARLLMDNLSGGNGNGHGFRIEGAADRISLINVTVEWPTAPATRGFGDGFFIIGYPSDSAPAGGWTGSTGAITNLTMINCRTIRSAQTGAVILGCSDVKVIGFSATDTKADGLHFNACRRITVNGHHATNTGDDGLAFVTYFHASTIWQHAQDGPFNQPSLGAWSNSGAGSAVTVHGGLSNGLRVQGCYNLSVSDLSITNCDLGIQLNSAVINVDNAWTSLASRNVSINNATISTVSTGIVLAANGIDGTNDQSLWRFSGCEINNVKISGATNWSVAVEALNNSNSKIAGIVLRDIHAIAGNGGGGAGGMQLASLYESVISNLKLVSDHGSDINIVGAAQTRSGTVEGLPSSSLTIDGLVLESPGRILIQDIAGIQGGDIMSSSANAEAIVLNRVKDTTFHEIKAFMPLRGAGFGRGLQILQCFNVDIDLVRVTTDNHVGSSWLAVELGGGDSTYPAGKGILVDKIKYTSTRNDTASDVSVQGGPYAPANSSIRAYWYHSGAASPAWTTASFT